MMTTEEVREMFQASGFGLDFKSVFLQRGAEFDRWLAGQKASALRAAAEHFVAANFSHTTTTPTLFSQPTPGRYGDARDEMTGHMLQRHDRLTVHRWLLAEADRVEEAA